MYGGGSRSMFCADMGVGLLSWRTLAERVLGDGFLRRTEVVNWASGRYLPRR